MGSKTAINELPYPEGTDPPAGHSQIKGLAEAVEGVFVDHNRRLIDLESAALTKDPSFNSLAVSGNTSLGNLSVSGDISMASGRIFNAGGAQILNVTNITALAGSVGQIPGILGGSGPNDVGAIINLGGLSKALTMMPRLYRITATLQAKGTVALSVPSPNPRANLTLALKTGNAWQLKNVPLPGFLNADLAIGQVGIAQAQTSRGIFRALASGGGAGPADGTETPGQPGSAGWGFATAPAGDGKVDISMKWLAGDVVLGSVVPTWTNILIDVVLTFIAMPNWAYTTSPALMSSQGQVSLPAGTTGHTPIAPNLEPTPTDGYVGVLNLDHADGNMIYYK